MKSIHCVVPTLNAGATLTETLQSLVEQRDVMMTVTLVDSGSTDETLPIAKHFGVEILTAEPGNMYRAINVGFSMANAEWLTYLNADDTVFPDTYARLVTLGEAQQADVAYGNCDYVNWQGRLVYRFASAKPAQLDRLFRTGRMGFAQPAAIFRRNVFDQLQGFDECYRFKADADFFWRAAKAQLRFARLNGRAVARFRLHPAQLSQRHAAIIDDEGARLFGAPKLAWRDQLTLRVWQTRNVPHYLARIARASWQAGRLRWPRTLEAYE